MSDSVSSFLLRRLHEHGVTRIYGYPGDGINGLLGAFHDFDGIDFIQARHEELAAFMACAHAKLTGELGVCLATSGPGAIHLLNGLYDAKLDHAPVLAIVGQQPSTALGSSYQQEVDLQTLFKDVAGEYLQQIVNPTQTQHVIDRAVQVARTTRSVTTVIIPNDVQEADYAEPPRTHGSTFTGGAIRRTCSTRAPSRRSSSAPGRATPTRRSSSSRTCSAAAWPARSTAATWCPTTRRGSPGRSACSAPSRPTR
jgi:pyruvate dehydrogenase (quinone)